MHGHAGHARATAKAVAAARISVAPGAAITITATSSRSSTGGTSARRTAVTIVSADRPAYGGSASISRSWPNSDPSRRASVTPSV